ncbi:MAG: hypothetical protein U5K54_03445 [Cytophagales bacterium]|nr:hypothetical protein [Cytophagales bacterium]
MQPQLGIENDAEGRTQLVNLTANGKTISVAALVQPGQAPGTLGVALGYGRTKVGKVGENIGANAYPLVSATETMSLPNLFWRYIRKNRCCFPACTNPDTPNVHGSRKRDSGIASGRLQQES